MKYSLLIVEDEPILRSLLVEILENPEIKIMQAENGKAAFEILKSHRFDAVLSDIKMPFMEGLDLLKAIRVEKINVPFILLTGHGDRDQTLQALKLGAFDFIDKPFEQEQLIEVVHHALEMGSELNFWKDEIEALKNLETLKSENIEKRILAIENAMGLIGRQLRDPKKGSA
jgi:DNA-binding NtrC family response regulator